MHITSQIIQPALAYYKTDFISCLTDCVDETVGFLFETSQHASDNQEERRLYEQYQILKQCRNALIEESSHIIDIIVTKPTNSSIIDQTNIKSILSIIGYKDLDKVLAFSQLESLLEIRFYSELHQLEKRNKALFFASEVNKSNMLFGLASYTTIISKLFELVEIDSRTQVMLINSIATHLSKKLKQTYQNINGVYIEAKILPNLKLEAHRSNQQDDKAKDKISESVDSDNQHTAEANNGYEELAKPPNVKAFQTEKMQEMFSLLSDIHKEKHGENEVNVSEKVFDQTLNEIELPNDNYITGEGISKLKEHLAQNLKKQGIKQPVLNSAQENSLDVIGMVFDQISDDKTLDQNINSSITQMQMPLIKSITKDVSFFENEKHPAREYLETVIGAAHEWHGTDVVEDIEKFSFLVDQDYTNDDQSFVQGKKDLDKYLDITREKSILAEKKHKASIKGKERMSLAREAVNKVIRSMTSKLDVDFMKDLFDFVFKDLLTLTLLREGKKSENWKIQKKLVKNLYYMTKPEISKLNLSHENKNNIILQVSEKMNELGFSVGDIKNTSKNLKMFDVFISDNKNKGKKFRSIMINGFEDLKNDSKKQRKNVKKKETRQLNEEEQKTMEEVKKVPFGSYFDFHNKLAGIQRKKLCWLNPLTNLALFVNPKGQKPLKKDLPELAIEIVSGTVVQVNFITKGFIAKALDTVYDKLSKLRKTFKTSTVKPE